MAAPGFMPDTAGGTNLLSYKLSNVYLYFVGAGAQVFNTNVHEAPFLFYIFIFTAARSFALLARGL